MIEHLPGLALLAALIIPFIGAVGIALADKSPNRREFVTLATAVLLFADVLYLLGEVNNGARPEVQLWDLLPGLTFAFAIEPLGMLFAVVASGLWILNSIYSIGYMRGNNETNQTRFYICFAIAISSAMAIAFAAPLFITALAGPVLGEKVGLRRWAAVIIGFAGPVLNPQDRDPGSGPLLILADGTWADARDWLLANLS